MSVLVCYKALEKELGRSAVFALQEYIEYLNGFSWTGGLFYGFELLL